MRRQGYTSGSQIRVDRLKPTRYEVERFDHDGTPLPMLVAATMEEAMNLTIGAKHAGYGVVIVARNRRNDGRAFSLGFVAALD